MYAVQSSVLAGLIVLLASGIFVTREHAGDGSLEGAPDVCAPAPAMVEASQWAQDNRDLIPRDLAGFGELSVLQRRAAFQYLSPDVQGALWEEHLDRILRSDAGLTDEQRYVIATVAGQMGQLFASPDPGIAAAELEAVIAPAFSPEEAAPVFGNLGPMPTEEEMAEIQSLTCVCHLDSLCSCLSNPWECTVDECFETDPIPFGCGCFFLWKCNGRCGTGGPD